MIFSKTKNQLCVVCFLAVFVLVIIFIVRPLFSSINKHSDNFSLQKSILVISANQLKDVKKFQDDYAKITPEIEKLTSSFINYEAPVKFIEFLEDTALSSGVGIIIRPTNSLKEEGYKSLTFEVIIAGSFPRCSRFLDSLEESSWIFELISFKIDKVPERSRWLKQFEYLNDGETVFIFSIKAYSNEKNE